MNPDVTIQISIGAGGAVTAQGVQSGAAAEAPVPLSLGELQARGGEAPPTPLSPEELAVATSAVAAGSAPVPLPIEQLQGLALATAPVPQPLGSLAEAGGLPVPRALDGLEAAAAVPLPLEPEQLGKSEREKGSRK
ncbi:MAG: hypothetical protein ACREOQ_06070 [Gemmatimonadales bacterium]